MYIKALAVQQGYKTLTVACLKHRSCDFAAGVYYIYTHTVGTVLTTL